MSTELRTVKAATAREPAEREPGPVLAARIRRQARISLLAANLGGALIVFALGNFVIPFPAEGTKTSNVVANGVGFVIVMIFGLYLGLTLSLRVARDAQRWLVEDRAPTPLEREATLRFSLRQTGVEALLWLAAALIFFAINAADSLRLGLQTGVEIVMGGFVTCSLT